uniref:WD repeat domain-containing protein 83 n=1 Tax=Brugia timori TaxID=42155 RepID=A0A0R3QKR9_9BILA
LQGNGRFKGEERDRHPEDGNKLRIVIKTVPLKVTILAGPPMFFESSSTAEDLKQIWRNKIHDVESLLLEADISFSDMEGIDKYKKKLKTEMKFLTALKDLPISKLKKYLETSNITHLQGLLNVAKKHSCCAFYKSFAVPQRKLKREVDLVVDGGAKWVKVVSRNVRGLAMDFIGAGGSANRSVMEQAQDYIEMAQIHPYFFKIPKIIFEFVRGVPDLLQHKLESFGIEVIGDTMDINAFVKLPTDFSAYDSDDIYDCPSSFPEDKCLNVNDCIVHTVNLDISTVFALISSLTHKNGANYNYASRLLNAQAALERKKPALPPLLKAIKGAKLIICRTAYDAVQSILSTVAGPKETMRAKKLFGKVEIVEDKLSERAAKLKLSDRISQRSKIIFGSGDYYKAVTVTANRHFVYAAAHQGIHFAVFVHESRAMVDLSDTNLPKILLRTIDCKQGAVRAVRFNVDGNYCLSCGADKSVKLWNPYKGTLLKTYTGTGWEVLDAQGSSDNSMILVGGMDKQLTVFDVETGKITRRWRGHNGQVNSVAFNEESTVAISACQDGIVRCFDIRDKNTPIQQMDEATDAVLTVDVNSHEIASGSADGSARIYSIRDGKLTDDFLGDSVTSLHFSADGQCLLASTKDGFIRLIDKMNGQLLADYTGHANTEYRVESCLLATDAHVVSGSEDAHLYIWSLIEMKILHKLPHPSSVVHSVSSHPKKPILLSSSTTNIFLWGMQKEENI